VTGDTAVIALWKKGLATFTTAAWFAKTDGLSFSTGSFMPLTTGVRVSKSICIYLWESETGELKPDDLRRRWDDPGLEKISHANYFRSGEYLAELKLTFLAPLGRMLERARKLPQSILGKMQDRPSRQTTTIGSEQKPLSVGGSMGFFIRMPVRLRRCPGRSSLNRRPCDCLGMTRWE
jgi:hypothetical protein